MVNERPTNDHNDLNPAVEMDFFDSSINGYVSNLSLADDTRPDGGGVTTAAETDTQQTVTLKPNQFYGFRDRNSRIFNRNRSAISALLRALPKERRTNPSKKNQKQLKCNKCSFKCDQSYGLKRHAQVHSKEKPFGCEICKKRFGYKHSLKQHSLRTHNVVLLD